MCESGGSLSSACRDQSQTCCLPACLSSACRDQSQTCCLPACLSSACRDQSQTCCLPACLSSACRDQSQAVCAAAKAAVLHQSQDPSLFLGGRPVAVAAARVGSSSPNRTCVLAAGVDHREEQRKAQVGRRGEGGGEWEEGREASVGLS